MTGEVDQKPLAGIVGELASLAPEIQLLMDEAHRGDVARAVTDFRSIGLSLDLPLVRSVLPARQVLTEIRTEVSLAFTSRRSASASVGLGLGARVLTSFYERRYESSEASRGRIAITVVAVPHQKSSEPGVE